MTAPAWEQKEFSNLIAWESADQKKSYSDLILDVDSFASPSSRLWLCEDQGAYQNALLFLKAWKRGQTVCLLPKSWPSDWKQDIQSRLQNFESQIPKNTFYLLPTSGSSGRPKLVIVTRENWTAFLNGILPLYNWKKQTRVALTFDGVFDPFIAMIFLTLSKGATLVPLTDRDKFDPFTFVQKNSIQVWSSVPSLISMNWARKPESIQNLPSVEQTLFTGEALSPRLLSLWKGLAPQSQIENLYGPVEGTVWATRYVCQQSDADSTTVPIGSALSSLQTSIQDGKLILKGPQVAFGYLTANGIQEFHSSYNTGDMVDEKKSLFYFLGRQDQQVKIRGMRIELEAIEAVVLNETQSACVCTVDESENLCLILSKPVKLATLFDSLKEKLPSSHLPRQYYLCTDWPLTASGKLDRQALHRMISKQELVKLSLQKDPA